MHVSLYYDLYVSLVLILFIYKSKYLFLFHSKLNIVYCAIDRSKLLIKHN